MTTTKLITRTQIQQYKQLSDSVHNDKLDQIIIEAQFEDLQPLLGEELYLAILKDVASSGNAYDDLLDGGDYTYRSTTYHNYGLRAVLAHYVYARYTMFGDVLDNPFGMTLKLGGNESQPISHATKKTFYQSNRNTAFNYWRNVERYLIRTENALFRNNCLSVNRTFKISRIG